MGFNDPPFDDNRKEVCITEQSHQKVVSRMKAYEDQAEGFTLTTHAVLPGEVLTVSAVCPDQWEGMAIIRALRGSHLSDKGVLNV